MAGAAVVTSRSGTDGARRYPQVLRRMCPGTPTHRENATQRPRRRASQPVGRVLCTRLRGPTAIHLGLPLPTASCGLPASIGRAALNRSRRNAPLRMQLPLDLAPGGVYRAAQVTLSAGGLLHHRFTLTPGRIRRRSVFCGTIPRVTPGRRYRPPCPAEPGPSSARRKTGVTRPPGQLVRRCVQDMRTGQRRRAEHGRAARHHCRCRPPHCELRCCELSESACPAGCRTRRCCCDCEGVTAQRRRRACIDGRDWRPAAGLLAGRRASRARLRRGRRPRPRAWSTSSATGRSALEPRLRPELADRRDVRLRSR